MFFFSNETPNVFKLFLCLRLGILRDTEHEDERRCSHAWARASNKLCVRLCEIACRRRFVYVSLQDAAHLYMLATERHE